VLMAEANRRLRPGQEVLYLGIDDDPGPGRAGMTTGKRSVVLWHVLTAVYAKLGFDTIGGRRIAAWDRHQVQRRLKASTRAATAGRRAGTSRS
jgi:hypothetical protein